MINQNINANDPITRQEFEIRMNIIKQQIDFMANMLAHLQVTTKALLSIFRQNPETLFIDLQFQRRFLIEQYKHQRVNKAEFLSRASAENAIEISALFEKSIDAVKKNIENIYPTEYEEIIKQAETESREAIEILKINKSIDQMPKEAFTKV